MVVAITWPLGLMVYQLDTANTAEQERRKGCVKRSCLKLECSLSSPAQEIKIKGRLGGKERKVETQGIKRMQG